MLLGRRWSSGLKNRPRHLNPDLLSTLVTLSFSVVISSGAVRAGPAQIPRREAWPGLVEACRRTTGIMAVFGVSCESSCGAVTPVLVLFCQSLYLRTALLGSPLVSMLGGTAKTGARRMSSSVAYSVRASSLIFPLRRRHRPSRSRERPPAKRWPSVLSASGRRKRLLSAFALQKPCGCVAPNVCWKRFFHLREIGIS